MVREYVYIYIYMFASCLLRRGRCVGAENLCCLEMLFLPFFSSLFSATKAAGAVALDQSRGWSL